MKIFQRFSIKNKLTSIILIVTAFAIAIGFVFVIFKNVASFKQEMITNMRFNAASFGESVAFPLSLGESYTSDVERDIEKLRAIPFISNAVVYDKKGDVFAVLEKNDTTGIPPKPKAKKIANKS